MAEFAPRVRWGRVGRMALLFVGLLLIYLYINPLRTYLSTYQEAKTKRGEVAAQARICLRDIQAPDQLGAQDRLAPGRTDRDQLGNGTPAGRDRHLLSRFDAPQDIRRAVAQISRRDLSHATNVALM